MSQTNSAPTTYEEYLRQSGGHWFDANMKSLRWFNWHIKIKGDVVFISHPNDGDKFVKCDLPKDNFQELHQQNLNHVVEKRRLIKAGLEKYDL